MLERAWSLLDETGPEWSEIGEVLLSVLSTTGAVDEALLVGERMLSVAEPEQRANCHLAMARAAAEASRWNTARAHASAASDLRGLMERSSLALWEYEPPHGIVAARDHAESAGALVVVAHLDNFLAFQAHDRHNTDQIEPAARRCIDLATRLRLPTLRGVATVALAIGAAHGGHKEQMERLLTDAEAISDGVERHVGRFRRGSQRHVLDRAGRSQQGRASARTDDGAPSKNARFGMSRTRDLGPCSRPLVETRQGSRPSMRSTRTPVRTT